MNADPAFDHLGAMYVFVDFVMKDGCTDYPAV